MRLLFATRLNALGVAVLANADTFAVVDSTNAADAPALRRRLGIQSQEPCILSKFEIEFEDQTSLEEWHCELQGTDLEHSGSVFVTLEGIDVMDLDVQAISGRTTLFAEGAFIADGKLTLPKGVQKNLDKIERRGPPETKSNNSKRNGEDKSHRQLAEVVQNTVLAMRVVAADVSTSADMSAIGDSIFGKNGDVVNLKERFETCSHGEMLMEPYEGATPNVSIQDGTIEVEISNVVNGADHSVIRDAAIAAARSYLGISCLACEFHHILLCLPPGTNGGWIAYAWMNSWLSVYNDNWCTYPSAQVHEVGHNLGLYHAGEGSNGYGDQTGMMGYSYSSDTTNMCYNPAKSSELGWYAGKRQTLNFSQHGGFRGSLVGIVDYYHTDADGKYVHLVIEGGDTTETLYVGFNRAAGFNMGTQEGRNQVTVHGQNGDGELSNLYAKLDMGGIFRITDFAGNQDLIIEVIEIDLSASPTFADVIVMLEDCAPGVCGEVCHTLCETTPTASPTKAPTTTAPTRSPTKSPITTVSTPGPTKAPTASNPTSSPTKMPTNLFDNWNVIFQESFENGLGVFEGGKNTKTIRKTSWDGNSSLEIKDGSTINSVVYTKNSYAVDQYQNARLEFLYYPYGGELFYVDVSTDDGNTWDMLRTFAHGIDWNGDGWFLGTVEWELMMGIQSIQLRIQTGFRSHKEKIYIDAVIFEAK